MLNNRGIRRAGAAGRLALVLLLPALSLPASSARALEWHREAALPATSMESVRRVDGTLYVGGSDRVYVGANDGATWSATAPLGSDGAPIYTALPAGGALWAAAATVGVFRSGDGGQHWAPVNTGLTGLGATDVAQFALKGTGLYAATLGAGVFRLDLGDPTRWSAFNAGLPVSVAGNVSTIVLNGTTLLAPAGGNGYVYRFPEGAAEWQETAVRPPILAGFQATDLAGDGTHLLVASPSSVYRSVDDGQTWAPADAGLPNGSAVLLAQAGGTFFAMVDFLNNTHRLYRTDDAGASWQPVEETADAFVYEIEVAGDRLWAARQDGLWWAPVSVTPTRRTTWSLLKGAGR